MHNAYEEDIGCLFFGRCQHWLLSMCLRIFQQHMLVWLWFRAVFVVAIHLMMDSQYTRSFLSLSIYVHTYRSVLFRFLCQIRWSTISIQINDMHIVQRILHTMPRREIPMPISHCNNNKMKLKKHSHKHTHTKRGELFNRTRKLVEENFKKLLALNNIKLTLASPIICRNPQFS